MPGDAGYATPAALVFSLGLALLSAALIGRSVALLRLSRDDLARAQTEYALDGAQLDAAAQVIRSGAGGPYHWSFPTDLGWVDAVAERESLKVGLAKAAQVSDPVFAAFQVADAAALRQRLAAAAASGASVDVAALDTAPLWRACAPSVFSALGEASAPQGSIAQQPHMGDLNPAWRVAEVWRFAITTAAGWRDDRLVRFTGDALHPAAIVSRRFGRSDGGQGRCDAILAGLG
jgi:hypothetical protein